MSKSQVKSEKEYFVSQGEVSLGPWTLDDITSRLASRELALTDFIYDEEKGDWTTMLEFAPLTKRLSAGKPKAPPPKSASVEATTGKRPAAQPTAATYERESVESSGSPLAALSDHSVAQKQAAQAAPETPVWFVQKGNNRYGPFSHSGIIRALQEKSIFEFDYIWKSGMDRWVRLAEHQDFSASKIREFYNKSGDKNQEVFFRRRYPRVEVDSEVIVHNNQSVWIGRAFEASEGGSGVTIDNATLVPGQVVLLHFSPSKGLPAFNALCEIVSKNFVSEVRNEKSTVKYGVKFVKIDSAVEPKVKSYFKDVSSRKEGERLAG